MQIGISTGRRGLLPLYALLLLIIASEFGLRLFLGLGHSIQYLQDPDFGYFQKPTQQVKRFALVTDVNQLGMRGSSDCLPLTPQTTRLLLVGDSITWGTTQVDQSQIFATLVERELPAIVGHSMQVWNVSAKGWAIANELAFLKKRGLFHAREVLLVLNSGDLSQAFNPGSEFTSGRWGENTALGEIWWKWLLPRVTSRLNSDPGTVVNSQPEIEQANLGYLDGLQTKCLHDQARLSICFIPFRRAVQTGERFSAQQSLVMWAHKNRVALLDLTSFVSVAATSDITLADRTHYNARGNRLIADGLERQLPPVLQERSTVSQDRF